ncbi:V-type proton ATPase 116 kDa subunit a-like [Cimex lectularius]|uniref:V-type proton ATPase subunit a n=1 Tax=Cimex lectularius TaxID=79782 RepID=A0A8I6RDP7_CIMLE|nr:V-type proton ATPase 116 kDa subunit a-like [Cimex lectularius]
MRFLRSEKMNLCNILIDPSAAFDSVANLGEVGIVQFQDLNEDQNPHLRKFAAQIKAIDALEQKLEILTKILTNNNIKIPKCKKAVEAPSEREILDLASSNIEDMDILRKVTDSISEVASDVEKIKENLGLNQDCRSILQLTLKLMSSGLNKTNITSSTDESGRQEAFKGENIITIIGGIISTSRAYTFETVISRICRGNFILHTAPNYPSKERNTEPRTEFIIFCHGTGIPNKIESLSKSYKAITLRIPNERSKCIELIKDCENQIRDIQQTLVSVLDQQDQELKAVAKQHDCWNKKLKKAKAIYNTLNSMDTDTNKSIYIAQCWVPEKKVNKLKEVLSKSESKGDMKTIVQIQATDDIPPTYFEQNKFTQAFQNIIDAYGVPSYQEINPMPFAVITFPFLFGVMFGDIGHGFLMFSAALAAVCFEKPLIEKKIDNEIWTMLFGGRYIILLMGAFSMYAGFMYNDCFGNSLNFESSWSVNYNLSTVHNNPSLELNPTEDYKGTPYPFGLDPTWVLAVNKIDFQNSFKMKAAIIFGIIQMEFGLFLSLLNDLYFKEYLNVYSEFLPRLIFFTNLFGYLVFLVFYKWLNYGPGNGNLYSSACAPSVLITFINMMLFKKYETLPNCAQQFYPGQAIAQPLLVYAAILCLPWMLLLKPTILLVRLSKAKKGPKPAKGHSDEGVMDIIVTASIHTIEFALGCVSYTASYLRLWALSLAHSQLSEVLWKMILINSYMLVPDIVGLNYFLVYIMFLVWSFLTVGILVLMEGLSAFLHALRLHWMEFQSKYYAGTGYLFIPFAFKGIIDD